MSRIASFARRVLSSVAIDLNSNRSPRRHARLATFALLLGALATSATGQPMIASFTPISAPPGSSVTINGSAFTGATSVTFGGVSATTFSVPTDVAITATVPSGAVTGPISVTTPAGTSTSASIFTVTTPIADLAISVSAPGNVDVGAAYDYNVGVMNNGPDTASNVTVTDTLPGGVTLGSAAAGPWSCSPGPPVVCTLPSLGAGSSAAFTLTVTAPPTAGQLTNTATVASSANDPASGDNNATTSTTACPASLTISAPPFVCQGSPGAVASATAIPGVTYHWIVTNGAIVSGEWTNTITFAPSGSGPVMLTVSVDSCAAAATATVPLQPSTAITTDAAMVCVNSTGHTASVPAQSGASYSWQIVGGTIAGSSTGNSITYDAGSGQVVNLSVTVSGSCGSATGAIVVPTSPSTMIATPGIVCPNSSTNIASVPSDPSTTSYSWTISGPGATIMSGANTNSITFMAGSSGPIELTVTSTGSCSPTPVSGTLRVDVGTPTIYAPTSVCGSGSNYSATVGGAPGASYAWTVNPSEATVTSGSSTNWITFTPVPGATSITLSATVSLVGCGTFNATKTIPVDSPPPPSVSITSAPEYLCSNGTGTATASNATGVGYFWSIGNGTITSGQGTNTITFTANASGSVYLNVGLTSSCGAGPTANKTIPINADTTITTDAPVVCINSGGHTASVPALTGASYAWTINGGTINGATNLNTVSYTAGNTVSVNLNVAVTTTCGTVNGGISIPTSPVRIIQTPTLVCPNTTQTASLPSDAMTTSYAWSISGTGASIVSGAATNTITYSVGPAGPVQLTVATTGSCSAAAVSNTLNIDVGTPTIYTTDRVCSSAMNVGASVNWANGATYQWTVTGATVNGSTTSNFISYTPSAGATSVGLSVVVMGLSCGTLSASKTVAVDSPPPPTVSITSAPDYVCANGTGTATATVVTGVGYFWSIGNGTITAGQGTNSITFTAGTSGSVNLNLSLTSACSPGPSTSRSVPINANTQITLDAPTVCINSSGHTASVLTQAGATYNWTINGGTITAGAGTNTITYTAGSGSSVGINVSVTTACGTANGGIGVMTSPARYVHADGLVCPNSTNTAYVTADPSTTSYSWSITGAGATILSGANTSSITYSVGAAGPVQLTVTSSGSCSPTPVSQPFTIDVGTPTIYTPARICATASNISASVNWASGASYLWSITGATASTALTSPFISFTPNPGATSVDLSVTVTGLACGTLTATKTIPVDPVTPPSISIVSAPDYVCANGSGTASATAVAGATYSWFVNGGTIASGQGTSTITFTAGASGSVNLNVSLQSGCGTTASATRSVPITANALITTDASTVCVSSAGHTATVPAQAGATYNWTISGGTITAGAGTNSITYTAGSGSFVSLNVAVSTSCGTANGGTTVFTSPSSFFVRNQSPGIVCPNSTGNTAALPADPATTSYAWSIAGAGASITSGANTNAITYSAGSTGPITLTVTTSGSCSPTPVTATYKVDVGALTINAPARVCAAGITSGFVASVGFVSGATYQWTASGGTISNSSTSSSISVVPAAGSSSVTLSVTVNGLSCGPLSATKTIAVDPSPSTVNITAPANVCPGVSSTASATPYAGATYNWSITGGTINTGQGTDTIAFTPSTGATVTLTVSTVLGCGTATKQVTLSNGLNSSMTAPSFVCASSSNTASVIAQTGTTYLWTISNGTITSGQSTNAITFTAGSSGTVVQVGVTVGNSCGSQTSSRSIPIDPIPAGSITAPTTVCANTSGNVALAQMTSPSDTYTWSIQNGTITSGAGTSSITFTAPPSGDVLITLVQTSACGFSTTGTRLIPVNGPPSASFNIPLGLCANAPATISFASTPAGATYNWSIQNGTITSAANGPSVTIAAGTSGEVLLTGSVTACGNTATLTRSIPINPPVIPVIRAESTVCPDTPGNRAGVAAPPGTTFAWSITNGTITSAATGSFVDYTAGASGQVSLTVTATTCGTSASSTIAIPIAAIPEVVIRGIAQTVCPNSTGNVASAGGVHESANGFFLPASTSYSWTVTNGTITSGANTDTITYTAGASGQTTVSVTATACGKSSTASVPIPIDTPPPLVISGGSAVCAGSPSNLAVLSTTTGLPGDTTYTWSIANGTITSSPAAALIYYTAGTSGTVDLTCVVTICGKSTTLTRNVPINSLADVAISAPDSLCANGAGYGASILAPQNATTTWSISNGVITSGSVGPNVTYSAGSAGSVVLTANISACGATATVSKTIPINGTPTATISVFRDAFFLNVPTMTQLCPNGLYIARGPIDRDASYRWTISGGTLLDNANDPIVYFQAGPSGSVTLGLSMTSCGGTATGSVSLPVTSANATITAPPAVCALSTSNTATALAQAGATYNWTITGGTITSGQGTSAITFTAGTSASVVIGLAVSSTCGAPVSSSVTVPVNGAIPPVITAPSQVGIASTNNTASVTAVAGATYLWSITGGTITSGGGTPAITFSAGIVGPVVLSVTVTSAGCPVTASTTIAVSQGATPVITGPASVCGGSTGTASVSPVAGATYAWTISGGNITAGNGTPAITFTAASAGAVTLGVTVATTTSSGSASLSIPITAPFTAAISTSTTACAFTNDNIASVAAVAGATYTWTVNGGSIIAGAGTNVITYTAGSTGPITVSVTVSAGGCTASASTSVAVVDLGTPVIAVPVNVCALSTGNTASIAAIAGATYDWIVIGGTITAGFGTNAITFTAGAGGAINLTVNVSSSGCSATASTTIVTSSGAPPVIDVATTVCAASTNTASVPAVAGATYVWTINGGSIVSGLNTSSITFTAGSSGTVSVGVTMTVSGCSGSASRDVPITAAVTPVINAADAVCSSSRNTAAVALQPGATYLWTVTGGTIVSGQGTETITYAAPSTGTVGLAITVTSGACSGSVQKTVNVVALPAPVIGGTRTVCAGSNTTLDAGPGFTSYLWSTGETTQTITVAPAVTTPYSVAVTNATGCTGTASATVTVTSSAPPTIAAPAAVCASSTNNTASTPAAATGATYEWTITGGSITGGAGTPAITFSAGATGSVVLNVTVVSGTCNVSGTASVPISAPPAPVISGPSSICPGSTAVLDAGTGYASYLWSTGATTQTITVSPTASTAFSVSVTNAAGCPGNASRTVNVTAAAAPAITAPPRICANTTDNNASVPATSGATYAWTITGGTITAGQNTNSIVFTAGASGSVALGVTVTSTGCGGTASQSIPIDPAPTATISGPVAACAGTSVTLDAGGGFASYLWSTGATTQTISVSPAVTTSYSVTVTSAAGCTASASSTLTVTPAPNAKITAPATVTALSTGNSASVVTGSAGTTYQWTITGGTITSSSTASSIIFTAGSSGPVVLGVDVSVPGGCRSTGTATVTVSTASDLAVAMTASSTAVVTGGTVTYSVALTNSGPNSASRVTLALTTQAGAAFGAVTGAGWTCTVTGTAVTCTLPNGGVGALPPVTAALTAPSLVGTVSTVATISSDSSDPKTSNNVASVTTSVTPPACSTTSPQLVSPADGAANLTSPVTFSWTAVTNASLYEVWASVDGAPATIIGSTSGTSLSLPVSGKSATWYVGARFEATCPVLFSGKRSFTIFQPPVCEPAAATLSSPAQGGVIASPVLFTWQPVTGAVGYRVWITVDGGAPEDVGTTDASKTSLTAAVAPGAIAWYVETRFSGCPSINASPVAFSVPKPDPCAGRSAASPTAPPDQSNASSSALKFSWNPSARANGYRVWASIDGAPFAVLGSTTAEPTLGATISSGDVEWYVESLFEGCASVESPHRKLNVPKAVNCGNERPTLLSPSDNAVVTSNNVAFSWTATAGATSYEVWLALGNGSSSLLGTTTGTTLTKEVAAGDLDWFVRASFDGCPSRDSQSRRLTYTPPPACPDARPLPSSPVNNAAGLYSPVDFSWKEVPGATQYKLWASLGGRAAALLGTTPVTTFSQVNLEPGLVDWYVEAITPAGCATLVSSHSQFTVASPPAPCSDPEQPVIIAESSVSSGVQYLIRWQGVAPGNAALLQESLSGSFADAVVINTTSERYAFVHTNSSLTPLTYYYRVRAIGSCNGEQQLGPYSAVVGIAVLPDKPVAGGQQLQGSSGVGSTQLITYTIPLDSSFAGLSFTATPNEPWLTVTPSTGVVPAAGLTLTVTANPKGLPVGTTLGGILITTSAGAAGHASPRGGTTINTTVSVNVVQPILPTPKNTPPPDALIIPAVAHADGINSKFQSDVRLTNASAQPMKYQITFTPSGADGLQAGKQTSVDVDPGRTIALDDVLGTWFSSGAIAGSIGTLEIRPLQTPAPTNIPVAVGAAQNLVTFASSRTFNATTNGTFGQYVPAIPFANFIGGSSDPARVPVLSLQQIAQSATYRTNLGLVEGSGQPATAMVSVFGASGAKLTDFPVNLAGGQHVQLNSFLAQRNIALEDGRVEVKVTSAGGRVTAYASVLDNNTGDPLLITPVTLSQGATTKWVVPGVADLRSSTANWQTDMRIFNATSSPVDATLTFYSQNLGQQPRTMQMSFAPSEVKQLDSTLSSLFGLSNDGGALHISTNAASNLVATARTYNRTTTGTYGQFVAAVTANDAVASGSRPLQILQVEESSRFRSNIGIAEVSGKPVRVQVAVIPADGRVTGVVELDLAANQFRQLNSLLATMGLTNTYNARVTVRVIGGTGRVTAYASVIDSVTQDPTFVPAQ